MLTYAQKAVYLNWIFLRIYANMLESGVKDTDWQQGFSYDHLFFSIVVMNQITGCFTYLCL